MTGSKVNLPLEEQEDHLHFHFSEVELFIQFKLNLLISSF